MGEGEHLVVFLLLLSILSVEFCSKTWKVHEECLEVNSEFSIDIFSPLNKFANHLVSGEIKVGIYITV